MSLIPLFYGYDTNEAKIVLRINSSCSWSYLYQSKYGPVGAVIYVILRLNIILHEF